MAKIQYIKRSAQQLTTFETAKNLIAYPRLTTSIKSQLKWVNQAPFCFVSFCSG